MNLYKIQFSNESDVVKSKDKDIHTFTRQYCSWALYSRSHVHKLSCGFMTASVLSVNSQDSLLAGLLGAYFSTAPDTY